MRVESGEFRWLYNIVILTSGSEEESASLLGITDSSPSSQNDTHRLLCIS